MWLWECPGVLTTPTFCIGCHYTRKPRVVYYLILQFWLMDSCHMSWATLATLLSNGYSQFIGMALAAVAAIGSRETV